MTPAQRTRTWFITGATSGLGRALALAALEAGGTVLGGSRRPERFAALVTAHPGRAFATYLDVTDTAAAPAAISGALARLGRVDVLVNAAGRGLIGAAEESGDAETHALMDLHFHGPAALTRAALPHLRAQGSGWIVQIRSMGGRASFAGVGAYAATTFALEGWSEALAQEVGDFGVRVPLVEPGAFRTGFAAEGTLAGSAPLAPYEGIIGPVWRANAASDGTRPGDPAKAAAAVRTALAAAAPPLRLPLGADAHDLLAARAEAEARERERWQGVGRGTGVTRGE
ncbi:SDR family NAD(P)-dependent oxidoreductase [Streptomyces sp. P6-2-1]|uniref:SDR family NAD(P)-dependent oxidoreductase n=1 Tax=Streptomyces sp. P6-2-1 TaxID=3422591 RepID=UPI003D365F0D